MHTVLSVLSGWDVQWAAPAGAQQVEKEVQEFIFPPSLLGSCVLPRGHGLAQPTLFLLHLTFSISFRSLTIAVVVGGGGA